MREILFRGKRVDKGEWVYGYYVYCDKSDSHLICEQNTSRSLNQYGVIHETVGQFTGLLDKNKVKVFEGDIFGGRYESCYISWDEQLHGWNFKWTFNNESTIGDFNLFEEDDHSTLEVIGNIYENEELIK
jgi:uncharacterized phage protein (TIGR01671 family)